MKQQERFFIMTKPFHHLGIYFAAGTRLRFIRNMPELESNLFHQPAKDSNGRKCCGTISLDYDSAEEQHAASR